MKRPIPVIAFAYLIATVIAIYTPNDIIAAAILPLAALFVVLLIIYRIFKFDNFLPLAAISAAIALGSFLIFSTNTLDVADKLSNSNAVITGTVTNTGISEARNTYYIVKADTINDKKAPRNFNIILYCDESDDLKDYDKISFSAKFFKKNLSRQDDFYLTDSVVASAMTIGSVKITNKDEFSLLREICLLRDKMIYNMRVCFDDEECHIMCGILFGKRDNIDDSTNRLFATSGISHLLAVSGLHLTILIQLLNLILVEFGLGIKSRFVFSLLAIFIIMTMTGFSVSIIRSAIMMFFIMIANIIRRDYNGLTTLGISAIVIVALNPYAVLNIGFLLSFCATAGLLVSTEILDTFRWSFKINEVDDNTFRGYTYLKFILPCITAYTFTIPVSAYVFGYTSLYSPVVNLLIAPFTTVLLAAIILGAALSLTSLMPLYYPFLYLAKWIVKIIVFVAESFSKLPFSKIELSKDSAIILILAMIILVPMGLYTKHYIRNSFVSGMLCTVILCTSVMCNMYYTKDYVKLNVIDCDSGALVIEYDNKYIINGYNKDSSYEIDSIISSKENPALTFISIEDADVKDIPTILSLPEICNIDVLSVPINIAVSINSVKDRLKAKEICMVKNTTVSTNNVTINSYSEYKNTVINYNIEGFKITYADINSKPSGKIKIDCDLLITNSGLLYFKDNYKTKYMIISEKVEDENQLSNRLSKNGIKYICDNSGFEIYIKDKKIYKTLL